MAYRGIFVARPMVFLHSKIVKFILRCHLASKAVELSCSEMAVAQIGYLKRPLDACW